MHKMGSCMSQAALFTDLSLLLSIWDLPGTCRSVNRCSGLKLTCVQDIGLNEMGHSVYRTLPPCKHKILVERSDALIYKTGF